MILPGPASNRNLPTFVSQVAEITSVSHHAWPICTTLENGVKVIKTESRKISAKLKKETKRSQAPVAHACNPSYSGGRDQEDRSLKPTQAKSS
jgi:hypothetical protein